MPHAARERARTRRPRRDIEERTSSDEGRDEREENETRSDDGGSDGGAFSQLKGVMSEAAVGVLSPVAKKLATQAAKMAVERGPELLEDTILPKLQDLGGNLGEKFGGGDDEEGGGGAGDGTGKGRRMPIQQAVDVAAPLDVVYDQFTQFEDYPKFMHRVERAEQRDEAHVVFSEKIWGVRRQWEAEIVEQSPDERIVWKTVSGMSHVGVVTFHELGDRLTRIELNVDIDPDGPIEKIARGARFAKRAARADLKRFKAFVEMRDEETGAWRGAIEDGEVVEEDDYEDKEDEEEPEAYEDKEPEAKEDEDDEEPEAYEDEDAPEDDEEEEQEEDDEEPSRRATAKSKNNGGREKQAASSTSSSSRRKSSSSGSSSRAKASGGGSRAKSAGSRAKSSGGGARKPRA